MIKIILLLILFFFNTATFSLENKILFKINNEIISTIDLYNETKYLSLLNKDLTNLKKDKIFEILRTIKIVPLLFFIKSPIHAANPVKITK